MKKETYIKMTETVLGNPALYKTIYYTDKILTLMTYASYPVFLLILLCKMDAGLLKAVMIPGVSFVAVSVFRKKYNAQRPYEVFRTPAAIKKDTVGKSFPSRHVFSIFVIGTTTFYFYPAWGSLLCVAGIILAAARVIGGVHFTKDVIAGAIIGILSGLIIFIL